MINRQYGFLSSMLERFPYLMNEWIEKQKKEVEELAREYAEGDEEGADQYHCVAYHQHHGSRSFGDRFPDAGYGSALAQFRFRIRSGQRSTAAEGKGRRVILRC